MIKNLKSETGNLSNVKVLVCDKFRVVGLNILHSQTLLRGAFDLFLWKGRIKAMIANSKRGTKAAFRKKISDRQCTVVPKYTLQKLGCKQGYASPEECDT